MNVRVSAICSRIKNNKMNLLLQNSYVSEKKFQRRSIAYKKKKKKCWPPLFYTGVYIYYIIMRVSNYTLYNSHYIIL